MSAEKPTRVKSDLPHNDWQVVARLIGLGSMQLGPLHGAMLQDLLPKHFDGIEQQGVIAAGGDLYVQFEAIGTNGDEALHSSAALLWHGLARACLPAEVEVMCDSKDQINPDRPIDESFPYMQIDATHEFRDSLADFDIEPPVLPDNSSELLAELEHLSH